MTESIGNDRVGEDHEFKFRPKEQRATTGWVKTMNSNFDQKSNGQQGGW